MSGTVTVMTLFHCPDDPHRFDDWANEYVESACQAEGFAGSRVSVHDPNLDSSIEVAFRTADQLEQWLDGPARGSVLREGRAIGYRRCAADLVLRDNQLPDGVAVFMHEVTPGEEADFVAAQSRLVTLTAHFPGNEGATVFPPDSSGEWKSVLRFRNGHQLLKWLRSREREEVLPELRAHLTENFSELPRNAPFGATVRTDFGETRITPGWKTAMIVVLCLYPTVMLLSRFLGPELSHLGFAQWLAIFVANVVSVVLLQWLLVPAASRLFRRWLDPVDGAGLRTTLVGAAVVLLSYGVILLIFGSVSWLQF